ncbi:hypothetical protein ACFRCI_26615 [Streptomyces sp. NPDC056638]|uniref:hypothetical protein n=1 Tax=Streptomyces sp. NPDC056638 TaxID=3345887 RepID=UPI00367CB0F3
MNFLLFAPFVERLTGRPCDAEIDRRLVQLLRLGGTSVPRGDNPFLHGLHVHGYIEMPAGRLEDATVQNQSYAYGNGEMTSTVDDSEHLTSALCAGRLLPARLLRHVA